MDARSEEGGRDDRREMILGLSEEKWRQFVDEQFRAGTLQFQQHQEALAENTSLTQKVADSTHDIVAAFEVFKSGFATMSTIGIWVGRIARWTQRILMIGGFLWALFHGKWTWPRGED